MNNNEIEVDENDLKKDDYNYKGYFIENDEVDAEPKYFEFGAHFSYKELYMVLDILRQKQLKTQKGKQIEKVLQINKKKASNRERNNTKNKDNEKENNLNQIINIFKFQGKSRNIENKEHDELTFIPKNNFNNFLSLKKGPQNKSTNNYKSSQFNHGRINYLKIYKNKIHNIKLDQIQFGKFSEKYLLTKKKQNFFINQRNKLFSKSKPKNKKENNKNDGFSNDLSLQKSFQTQIHQIEKKAKKNIKMNFLPYLSNSISSIEKGNKTYKKENTKSSQIAIDKIVLKKIQFPNKKEIEKSKHLNNLLRNNKSKQNKDITEYKNNTTNKVKIKETKETKILPTKKNISIKIDNNDSNINEKSKPIISVSIDNNNNIEVFDNDKMRVKIKSVKHQINKIKNLPNLNIDFIKKNKLASKIEKNNKKLESKKSKESLNILINKNNENISRNKFYDLMKNIRLNTGNKSMNNNLSKINNTQQNINYLKKHGLNKKKKTIINNKNNYKHLIIGVPSYSNSNKKKNFFFTII